MQGLKSHQWRKATKRGNPLREETVSRRVKCQGRGGDVGGRREISPPSARPGAINGGCEERRDKCQGMGMRKGLVVENGDRMWYIWGDTSKYTQLVLLSTDICDMIKGNESLVENVNSYFLAPFFS